MTNMLSADRTLEVACGPGKHSLMLASSFLKPKGVLVSCDYSNAMVKRLQENYHSEHSDFLKVQGNKFQYDSTDYTEFADDSNKSLKNKCDLDQIISQQGDFRKFVLGCQANNEILPFADQSFNAYIANLSVMIVENPRN